MRKRGISDLPTHSDVYLTVPAFAEHLNVPDKTVRKWLHAGVLTAYRFQSEWHFEDGCRVIRRRGALSTLGRSRLLFVGSHQPLGFAV
jgi:excisionase family DNA binding protein